MRWYQQWSTGFWEPSGTGLVGVKTSTSYPQFYPFAVGADGTFAIQAQVVAEQAWGSENFFVNRGDPVSFVPDRWYCIEVFVKLNTPGAADGQLAAWIDGEQKLSYGGRQFRGSSADDPGPSTSAIDAILVTGHTEADAGAAAATRGRTTLAQPSASAEAYPPPFRRHSE